MSDYNEVIEETETHRVVLIPDDDYDYLNPRTDFPNRGVMWCRHRNYNLGDASDEADALGRFIDQVADYQESFADLNRAIVKHLMRTHGATVILPLFLYEHSGISMSAGANLVTSGEYGKRQHGRDHFAFDPGGWDAFYIGFIFDTAAAREKFGADLDVVEQGLRDEVQTYDSYLRGDVWGYRVEQRVTRRIHTQTTRADGTEDDDFTEEEDWEEVDACWGFIGHKWAVEEARDAFAPFRKERAA